MASKSTDLLRQPGSQALVSNDSKSYQAYIQQRDRNTKINQLSQDIDTLKGELGEIKDLLVKLINGK
jgi:hypothetical protein